MKIRHVSVLLAAMIAGGAAFATTDYGTNYTPASETSNSPLRAGEASTMTGGAPNLLTTNSPYGDRSGATGHEANMALTASQTSDTPIRAGEMSTMTNGVPNVATNNMVESVDTASMTLGSTTAMGAGPVYLVPAPIYVVPSN